MLLMSKSKHKKALLIGFGVMLLIGVAALILTRPNSYDFPSNDPDEILHELERVTAYEADNGCMETNASGNRVFCGESKKKIDALQAQYQESLKAQFEPNPAAEAAIRTFMDEPDLMLSNQGLRHPSNFTVSKREAIDNYGSDRIMTPPEWERKVYLYNQESIASNCQFYSYEVDARYPQVVQVQLIGGLAVGSEGDIAQAECLKAHPLQPITAAQAKEMALAIARKRMGDLVDPGHPYVLQSEPKDGGDRYDFVWQYKDASSLPAGLTVEPYAYPTVRVVINKNGYLMTYLNTSILYAPE